MPSKKKTTTPPSDCTIGATEDTGKRPAKKAAKTTIPAAAGLTTAATPKKPGKSAGRKSATTPSNTVDYAALKPQPLYGISRIDQPDKKNHGHYLRLTGHKPAFFADKKCGGKNKGLLAAKAERDRLYSTLPNKLKLIGSKKRKTKAA